MARAAALGGAVDVNNSDLLDPRPVTFFLGWDAGHLYMACRAYLPAGYKPTISTGRSQDGASCFDDGLELLFKPLGKNVDNEHLATEFKLNINALGYGGDYTRLVVGQIMKNSDPQVKAATRFTAPNTAPNGGSWWEMEAAFSNKDFELAGDNRAGDNWLVMLAVNHMPHDVWMQGRIPCIGGYFTPQGKTKLTLTKNAPAIQLCMDSLSNLASDGTASLAIKGYNPTDTATQVKVDVDVASKIVKTATLDLPPGGEKTFDLSEKLPADVTTGRIGVHVSERSTQLLNYNTFFKVGAYPTRTKPLPPRNPNEFDFAAKFNPLRGLLHLRADTYYLPEPEAAQSFQYSVKCLADGKVIASGEIKQVQEWYFDEVLRLPAPASGKYVVSGKIVLKDGKSFGPRQGEFIKKDEAKEFAVWWNNHIGDPERVIAPFTAITGSGEKFACLGREYRLSGLGLPVSIVSQGREILAAPARLIVTIDGKDEVIHLDAPTITDRKDWRVNFAGKASGTGLSFVAEGSMEQDGLVAVKLIYQPQGSEKVKIDALHVEYPVANETAECLLAEGTGGNFRAKSTLVLPTAKTGRLWSVFDIGRKGSCMKQGSFFPGVWLGNEQRGLLWWADNDAGWIPNNEVPSQEVVREGQAVILRNNLVSQPAELTEARQVSFTWMASPFKPLPQGWRMYAATNDGTFFEPFRGVRVNPKTGRKYWDPASQGNCNWIHPESENPAEWSKLWAEQKVIADQHVKRTQPFDLYASHTGGNFNHMSFQLIGYGHKSIEDAVFDYFGDEWYVGHGDTWDESYINYAMWLLDRAFREGGVVSTYWDLSFPLLFDSKLCGLSYQLPDHRTQPGYNSLNCRRFFQRLWAVQDKHGLNPGCTGSHSTNDYIFPSLPWISSVLDGERDWNLDASDVDWVDYYPIERMRAMSCPHNWGVGICWMGNFSSSDPRKIIAAAQPKPNTCGCTIPGSIQRLRPLSTSPACHAPFWIGV